MKLIEEKLRAAVLRGARVVTYIFSVPGWTPVETVLYKGTKILSYTRESVPPAAAAASVFDVASGGDGGSQAQRDEAVAAADAAMAALLLEEDAAEEGDPTAAEEGEATAAEDNCEGKENAEGAEEVITEKTFAFVKETNDLLSAALKKQMVQDCP